jgi:hypothetical protein
MKKPAEILRALTPQMAKAAGTYLAALAFEQTLRPIVLGYKKRVLEKYQFTNDGEIEIIKSSRPDLLAQIQKRVVLDPELSYLLNQSDWDVYYQECEIERIKAGLRVERDGDCPLLVAENLTRIARAAFVDALEPASGCSLDTLLCSESSILDQYVDLMLNLLGKLGMLENRDQVLGRIKGMH